MDQCRAAPRPVDVDDQIEPSPFADGRGTDHLAKFPGRVDVEQRERQRRRIERLDGEMQHNRASLPIE